MKRRRRTETTIETYEVLAIRTFREPLQVWCPKCGEAARMLKPESRPIAPTTRLPQFTNQTDASLISGDHNEKN